jgi:calcineurin-like phosphoesterase family protein
MELFESNPFIISDTHFGHINIQYWCNRPKGWEKLLINNWNNEINSEDSVLFLGDFSVGPAEKYKDLLNGKIFLIRGNHDEKSKEYYTSIGFFPQNYVMNYKNILFTHKPIKIELGYYNIHGHLHNAPNWDEFHIGVSAEKFNYKPKRFLDIVKEFNIVLKENSYAN